MQTPIGASRATSIELSVKEELVFIVYRIGLMWFTRVPRYVQLIYCVRILACYRRKKVDSSMFINYMICWWFCCSTILALSAVKIPGLAKGESWLTLHAPCTVLCTLCSVLHDPC